MIEGYFFCKTKGKKLQEKPRILQWLPVHPQIVAKSEFHSWLCFKQTGPFQGWSQSHKNYEKEGQEKNNPTVFTI